MRLPALKSGCALLEKCRRAFLLVVRRCAEAILKRIASNAPIALKYALDAVNKGLETSQSEGLALEASYFGLCAATVDKAEGTSAFLQKRAPQFKGS